MNNVFVYCEIEGTQVQEVSQELLTKGRKLANQLGVDLNAIVAGTGIKGKVEDQILPYGVDKLFVFDAEGLFPYTSAPHTDILVNLFKEEQPQIALMGATVIGRDLGPRVSSSLTSGLTADCTELEIGDYDDKKSGTHYDNLLYQIRPAFGGNIVAPIVNPDHRVRAAKPSILSPRQTDTTGVNHQHAIFNRHGELVGMPVADHRRLLFLSFEHQGCEGGINLIAVAVGSIDSTIILHNRLLQWVVQAPIVISLHRHVKTLHHRQCRFHLRITAVNHEVHLALPMLRNLLQDLLITMVVTDN